MKTFESFNKYLDLMVSASSEEEKTKIKTEFDIFFASLDAKEKKDFTKFQISIAEKVKLEMLDIENEGLENYLFLQILRKSKKDKILSYDELKRDMGWN